ncbi:MAG: hydrogenase expression/formation protein HypE [Anaerolineae bacterium UTCFX2]|jgi:hydrogenase expression/formation protein HypE|nr:hydrogenase expression/formation protein HypE [Anaerolineae bacterium]MCZ7551749.1 hydrogenase expression/formation protein HypE [Anaerolineales bacterium]OQY90136.1 MAG: hydrogenase expression/formation protein HypE [Anaerolineae bacterium UTCFX2]
MDAEHKRVTLEEGPVCPIPLPHQERIVLGHGSGGKMTHDLVERLFLPHFDNPILRTGDDAAPLELGEELELALSTDSHVVTPLFFPGGDIGRLAVCGTVNDVAMLGAKPLYLTAGFILEEGLEMRTLERVIHSMMEAAQEAGVAIVAGDTKVVERGKADRLFINTTGLGVRRKGLKIGGAQARPGDAVLLSGPLGDHGMAVVRARGELGFEIEVESDTAPLNGLVEALLESGAEVHVLRDPTRGGLATTLNEIAAQSQVGILLDEAAIPVRPAVQAACEALGFDPLYLANEGRLAAIVAEEGAERALRALRGQRYGEASVRIGRVVENHAGRVMLKTRLGSTRVIERLAGEMLPRIC